MADSGTAAAAAASGEHEFRVGRLKHERIKMPRAPATLLLASAMSALRFHASRKAMLEIEFADEEGTGLGPTLEFFSLIAGELQRKRLAMWLCDDAHVMENEMSPDELARIDDMFVKTNGAAGGGGGLFPAPYPPDGGDTLERVVELFKFLGIFLAKSLQDQRLVDMPLSPLFLKFMCGERNPADFDLDDLIAVDGARGHLLKKLRDASLQQGGSDGDDSTPLFVEIGNESISLDDLGFVSFSHFMSCHVFIVLVLNVL